jgi:tetratricopeptide (TPR) repeat protein
MNSLATTFALSVVIGCSVAARVVIAQDPRVIEDPSPAAVEQLIERVRSSGKDQATISRGLGIGNMLLQARRYAEAVQLFKALAEKQSENPIVIYGYALATFNTGKPVDAEPWAQRAVALANVINDPDRPQRVANALVLLAVIQAVQKNDAAALKSLQQAVALAPNHFDAQLSLGRLLFGMGDNTGAIKAFQTAATLQPQNPQVLFFLATTLERSGDSENALTTYRKLVTLHPKIFEGHLGLGVLLLKRGSSDTEEGVKELTRALEINPNVYEARVSLGRALIAIGNPLAALEHLERAAQLAPDNPEPHYQLSLAYRRLGRKDEAAAQAQIVKRIHESRRNSKVPKQTRVG